MRQSVICEYDLYKYNLIWFKKGLKLHEPVILLSSPVLYLLLRDDYDMEDQNIACRQC